MNKNNTILKAIQSLYYSVDKTNLKDNEKYAMKAMLERVETYYVNRYDAIMKDACDDNFNVAEMTLTSHMTDLIVMVNDTLLGRYDVNSVVNVIYKTINFDRNKGKFKRKRFR